MLKLIFPFLLLATACKPVTEQNVIQGDVSNYVCTMPDGTQYLYSASSSDVAAACVLSIDRENLEDTTSVARSGHPNAATAPNGTVTFPLPVR